MRKKSNIMNSMTQETKLTIIYILVAFTFSVLMRMIWVYQFEDLEAFKYAGEFMINTNDGYAWAEGARDLLAGFHQDGDSSKINSAVAQLTVILVNILPFSFETIIFYMPVYISSLVVIPIVLIARNLGNLEMGLIASLLASIAWSYYNRTMAGYYDTDMLNIVLPMFLLWSIIWAIRTNEDKYLLITALDILVYRWWYPQSYALEFSFFGLILVYTLIYDRKNLYNYKLLAIMILAMLNLDGFIRLAFVIGTFFIFKQEKAQKYIYHILAISVILFFVSGGINPIIGKLKSYIFRDVVSSSDNGLGLHFFAVMQTVREAGQIPFETFANRISGHVIIFILSILGYIYLSFKHRIMLFALPMIGLGFLASLGGLRFTIYAVPILAFGIAFLITELASHMPTKKLKYLSMIALTLAILYPNYKHIDGYKVPTVFNSNEVAVLDALKLKTNRDDYVISWWDYGYPIRYYADVKTLVDGGRHGGSSNYPVSFILTNPQEEAAKMARLVVEDGGIEQITKDSGFKDTNDFLLSLQTEIDLPKKTSDIYLYLPFRMLNIYPTVKIFSNMDLMTGKKFKTPFFFISRNFKDTTETIKLAQKIYINKRDFSLSINGKRVGIKRFVKTFYNKNMKLEKDIRFVDSSANLSVIYMSSYNTFLVLDEQTYNSLYMQLMILEEYDEELFEKVIVNPYVKVYKLKL